jgi:hypothetical protein
MLNIGRLFEKRARDAALDQYVAFEYGREIRSLMQNGIPRDTAIRGIRDRIKK